MNTPQTANSVPFSGYQKLVVGMLAFLQFALILDFMLMAPLGALIMPALEVSPAQFGTVVSAYAFAAGASGLLAAGFADKFDRKKLLLFFYAGFVAGTLWCGLAQSFESLLLARVVTGMFGGVIGSVILAIATDLFPPQMRGRVMGFIQTAFAASQVRAGPARRAADRLAHETRCRAPEGAAGTRRGQTPARHPDRAALPAVVHLGAVPRDWRLHADALQQRVHGVQPRHLAA